MEKVLRIDGRDNVVTALDAIQQGETLRVPSADGDIVITAMQSSKMGHKLAIFAIAQGEPVIKYGAAIGNATADIVPGEHVHCHNLCGYRGRN